MENQTFVLSRNLYFWLVIFMVSVSVASYYLGLGNADFDFLATVVCGVLLLLSSFYIFTVLKKASIKVAAAAILLLSFLSVSFLDLRIDVFAQLGIAAMLMIMLIITERYFIRQR
jgi:hypothetical protein